jgi:REP element-mobilizing transposase RayT
MLYFLDIETKNVDISDLSFDDPKGWEISCICVVSEDNEIYTFSDARDELIEDAIFRNRINNEPDFIWNNRPLSHFFQFLEHLLWDEEHLVITKNGAKFDIPIIEEYLNVSFDGINHYDIEKHIMDESGERYRLSELIHYHIGKEEGKLLEAKYAPTLWSQGYYEVVVGYCIDDCYKTLQVYNDARMRGFYSAIDKHGVELKKVLF